MPVLKSAQLTVLQHLSFKRTEPRTEVISIFFKNTNVYELINRKGHSSDMHAIIYHWIFTWNLVRFPCQRSTYVMCILSGC